MTTNANARNETLLPRDVLAQPRVRDVVRFTFQAPAIGYINYRVASTRGAFTGSGSGTRFARFTRGEERERR